MSNWRRIFLVKIITGNILIKDFSVYTIGQGLSILSSLLLLPLFVKTLPAEDFGIIGILWLIIPLTSRLISLGMDSALGLQFFKLSNQELSSYLYNTLLTITVSGLVILCLSLWKIDWVRNILDPSINGPIFGVLIVSIVFSIYRMMMLTFLIKMRKSLQNVLVTVLPPLITAMITYVLIIEVDASYESYVVGMAVGNGIFALLALIFFFVNYPVTYFRFSFGVQKKLLRIGVPTLIGSLGAIVLASGDRYVIKWFLGLEAVAIYTLGYRIAEYISLGLLNPFQKAINPIIFKKAASNLEEASVYNYRKSLFILSSLSLLVAAIVIPMKDIMNLLGDVAYNQSYTIFLISLLGILLFVVMQISSYLLLHLERTDLTMFRTLLGCAINIGLNMWLIPLYGIIAGAFTTIFSYFVMFILTMIFVNRFTVNKQSIATALARLGPFIVFVGSVFLIDNVVSIWWQAYVLKFGLWFGLVFMTWLLFSEFRTTLSGILPAKITI